MSINPCGSDLPGMLGDIMPAACDGALVTAQVTAGGAAIALVLAFLVGLAATARQAAVRGVARGYMEFFRGTSVLVQLYWVFFAMPLVTGYRLTPVTAGVVALGLNLGAYGSEVVRGSIRAVPEDQREAATALSLSPFQRLRFVILPQAFAGMIPPMNNLFIELLKATSLVSVISVADLTFEGRVLVGGGTNQLVVWTVVLVIYFVFAYLITLFMRALERKAGRTLGRIPPAPRRGWRLLRGRVPAMPGRGG